MGWDVNVSCYADDVTLLVGVGVGWGGVGMLTFMLR